MSDDFSDYPRSVKEVRAERADDATAWTPRDALIKLLREIDEGLSVDALVICYRVRKDELPDAYCMNQACSDLATALGVWQAAKDGYMFRVSVVK